MNKELIKDLIEILNYKEYSDINKEQYQQWLNERLNKLEKSWNSTFVKISFDIEGYDNYNFIMRCLDDFRTELLAFIKDYKKEENDGK